jgi:hypothetical protein
MAIGKLETIDWYFNADLAYSFSQWCSGRNDQPDSGCNIAESGDVFCTKSSWIAK